MHFEREPIQFVRELMKDKSEAKILEAEGNFRKYLKIVLRIAERKAREGVDLTNNNNED